MTMGSEALTRPKRRRRTIAAAVGAALLMVLFVAGLAFANSIAASRVADNARRLHWTNAALGTSSLARAALIQAVTAVELRAKGLATTDDVEFVMAQAHSAQTELEDLEAEGVSASMASLDTLSAFSTVAADVFAKLDEGNAAAAESIVVDELETSYQDLSDVLYTEQIAIQSEIADHTDTAARTNSYIVFALTLAIPAAAVATYWWVARGQVREYRIKAETELEAERALSRAKDSFIAGLSHELRTPLTSIYGFAEVLTETGPNAPDDTPEVAGIIASEAAELTRMVDDLLAAARLDSTGIEIHLAPTRVNDVLQSATAPFLKSGFAIKQKTTGDVVLADGARLRHVLVNLVSNAVRHGGPEVGIEASTGDGTVDIEVWDNGPGVPDDRMERLFERFVHDGHETLLAGSVGLGLAVASRLTEMMGGVLTYQRYSNKTYFIVRLPAPEPASDDGSAESVAEVIRTMST